MSRKKRRSTGRLPAELLPARNAPTGWPADASRLLDWLRGQMTDAQLDRIAGADYARDRSDHLDPLRRIVRTGRLVAPLRWYPAEVLSLTQWDDSGLDPSRRLFACTVLCIDADSGHRIGLEATLAVALESALELGDEALAGYAALCAAMAECLPSSDPPHLFALLGLALATAPSGSLRAEPEWWRTLIERMRATEAGHAQPRYARPGEAWLLRTTFFDQRHGLWRRLSRRVLGSDDLFAPPDPAPER